MKNKLQSTVNKVVKSFIKAMKNKSQLSVSKAVKLGFIILWLFTLFLATQVSVEICRRGWKINRAHGRYTESIDCESIIESVTNEFEQIIEAKAPGIIRGLRY